MPDSVLVSTPSSRLGAASYSRSHVSRLYFTLISNPLWVGPGGLRDQPSRLAGQDLLGRRVRHPVAQQGCGKAGLAVQQVPGLGPRPLPDQVGGLVLEPRLGAPAPLAADLQVLAVPADGVEDVARALAARG